MKEKTACKCAENHDRFNNRLHKIGEECKEDSIVTVVINGVNENKPIPMCYGCAKFAVIVGMGIVVRDSDEF